jgi:HD-like signal output (HDOD) protein
MRIDCPNCHRVFNIPNTRIPKKESIAFPCPNCRGIIELDPNSERIALEDMDTQRDQNRLTGTALKKKILSNVMDLPPMPQTVLKAREIMADPNSDFRELSELLKTDQAIAAKILRLANSSYYGLSGKVSSVQRAAVVLGHKTIAELITMGGASSLLGNRLEGYGLDGGDLWKHSLAVGFGSKIIAGRIKPAVANDAFTSGLIQDSGKLILDRYIGERWESFEEYMSDGQHTFLEAEKEILELDHSEVASEVCKAWKITENLTTAIRYHHHPSKSQGSLLAYIIHIADAIAMMAGLGLGIDGTFYEIDEGAMEFLGLQEEDINDIMGATIDATQKILE